MPLDTGQILHNRYRVVKLIGQGGFGAVYRAWDTSLDLPCALKENMDTSDEAQRQFRREAAMLARLRHPNLPRVIDHFLIPGRGQYLVMDFIEGQSLAALLSQRAQPLDEAEVLPWIAQVCDALQYLHSRTPPIIHRDVKPQNIIITPEGQAMLVDFGISKVYDPTLQTTVGARAVTPGFSPPEQYGAGTTDPRTDVYALGATLYMLLTGQSPPESVQRMVGSVEMPPPRQVNPAVTATVEQAILRATEVTTSRRFQSVADLRAALAGQPPVQDEKATVVLAETAPAGMAATPPPSPPPTPTSATAKPAPGRGRWWLWLVPLLLLVLAVVVVSLLPRVVEEPAVEERAVEEPAVEEPPAEEPPAEEPPAEEPAALPFAGQALRLQISWRSDDPRLPVLQELLARFFEPTGAEWALAHYDDYEEFQRVLEEGIPAGQGPDIFLTTAEQTGSMVDSGLIVPITRWFNQSYLYDNFEPAAAQSMIYRGDIWGIPISQEAVAIFFNWDLVSDEMFPRDVADFEGLLIVAAEYHAANPDRYLLCNPALGVGNGDAYFSAPIYFGFGGPEDPGYVDEDGNVYLNTPERIAAGYWLAEFSQFSPPEIEYAECVAGFLEGRYAAIWNGPWLLPELWAAEIPYGIVPFGRPMVGVNTWFLSPNALERGNRELAAELLAYLGSSEVQLALSLAVEGPPVVPANSQALYNPELQGLYELAQFGVAAHEGVPFARTPFMGALWEPVGNVTSALMRRDDAPELLLTEAQAIATEAVNSMR